MLKLQYSGHLMRRTTSLEKTMMLGKIEGRRRSGRQRKRCLDSITNSMDKNLSKFPEAAEAEISVLQSMGSQRVRHKLATEQQQAFMAACVVYFLCSFILILFVCLNLKSVSSRQNYSWILIF